ncbi:serine/threonine protein kinase, partial [Kitasatospora sp. NPDC059571]
MDVGVGAGGSGAPVGGLLGTGEGTVRAGDGDCGADGTAGVGDGTCDGDGPGSGVAGGSTDGEGDGTGA